MTIEKARRICDVLSDFAETYPGERSVACLNAIESFEDELDADERVNRLTRSVLRPIAKGAAKALEFDIAV